MKLIPLHGKYGEGKFAKVDDEDYHYLMKFKWLLEGTRKDLNTHYVISVTGLKKSEPTLRMHRLVMKAKKCEIIDHKDHNGLNCQKDNLRIVTHAQNQQNKKSNRNSSSKYLGVTLKVEKYKGKITSYGWVTRIGYNKILIHLGCFPYTKKGEIDAAKAYDKKALELRGEFTNLNFKKPKK